MGKGADGDLSPSRFCFCPQVILEPVLAGIARERGGDLRFGVELTGLAASETGVTATLRGEDGVTTLDADYVIAADGAASPVRSMLGIPSWVDRGFALLACPDAPDWETVAVEASRVTGVPVAVHRIGHGSEWAKRNALADDGALLVRPDQYVAARTDEGLSLSSLADVLRAATGRSV
jgi:2-polyprenyl-6-methoxyphenol hydroxylase-like FAD-dependent oxidoreductase